jgi:hypothetical protein
MSLGQGNIGKGLPSGVALPHGVGSKGLGKGLSESEKFQEMTGPVLPGAKHSPVQKQDDDDWWEAEAGAKGDAKDAASETRGTAYDVVGDIKGPEPDTPEGKALKDAEEAWIEATGAPLPDAPPPHADADNTDSHDSEEVTFTEEEAGEVKPDSQQCNQGGANCPESKRTVWGDVDENPSNVDPRFLKRKSPPSTKQILVADDPAEGGEGGQPTHFVPSPVMVNPGTQDVDLPPGALENLNKNLQEKIISGDKPHVIMDPPKD